jgi:hypothetical protein
MTVSTGTLLWLEVAYIDESKAVQINTVGVGRTGSAALPGRGDQGEAVHAAARDRHKGNSPRAAHWCTPGWPERSRDCWREVLAQQDNFLLEIPSIHTGHSPANWT